MIREELSQPNGDYIMIRKKLSQPNGDYHKEERAVRSGKACQSHELNVAVKTIYRLNGMVTTQNYK